MMKAQWNLACGALAALIILNSVASAGTINPAPAPTASGPGLGFATVAAVITVQANNDNVPNPNFLDNNVTVPLKRFDFPNYIDIEFTVSGSGGVTEYQVSEFVDNNTGTPWSQYRMQLGFGTGAAFVLSTAGDGLDFDTPNNDTPPSSAAFPVVGRPDEDQLVYSGAVHGGGAQPYALRIDVPDLATGANGRFTLRQIPTPVPEPSVMVLVAMSTLGLAIRRRG